MLHLNSFEQRGTFVKKMGLESFLSSKSINIDHLGGLPIEDISCQISQHVLICQYALRVVSMDNQTKKLRHP